MRLPNLITAALAMTFAGGAVAQENSLGADSFAVNCVVCHGTTGAGDGEFADVLTVKPTNLSTLSAKNHGEFPYLKVLQAIDGRTTIRAHGVAMPIWGNFFKEEVGMSAGPFGAELLVRAKMIALVDYIETLQK